MAKNKGKKRASLLKRLFLGRNSIEKDDVDIFQEEQMQSPGRTVVKNFLSNKLSMTGLIVVFCIFLFVLIGPIFFEQDLSYEESTQVNLAPGLNLMSIPGKLQGQVADISVGSSFSAGVAKNGGLYLWGKTKVLPTIDLKNFPKALRGKKFVKVAAGADHIVALTDKNELIAWGNSRLKQTAVNPDIKADGGKVVQLTAGYQISGVVMDNGNAYVWGNNSVNDAKIKRKYSGKMQKLAFTADTLIGLTKSGEVVYLGSNDTETAKIPESAKSDVIDIATSGFTVLALKKDGTLVAWGNSKNNENKIPELKSKVVSIAGGRYHYTAVLEDGSVVSWGKNNFGQTEAPKIKDATGIFAGYYQNYVLRKDNTVKTFGLKGYILGTDDLGRDLFNRIVNGGRMTMTMGAISVIISVIIGVIIGGISGFFGGKVDMILQRLTEMVSSIPFLPFAMILSSIVGGKLPEGMRIFMIMVILGVLSWTGLSRLVRAQVLAEREQEFVTAARAMGIKELTIVFKHIIPNVISVIIVTATLDFASCMLTESSLSFLGFGVALPRPTWGNMLNGCINSVVIRSYWWRWVFPSVLLGVCCICINLVGDGLRDAIDPKSNER